MLRQWAVLLLSVGALSQLVPPDVAAYRKALAETDPVARGAALERFLAAYPQSPGAQSARDAALELMLQQPITDAAQLTLRVRRLAELAGPAQQQRARSGIAAKLLDRRQHIPLAREMLDAIGDAAENPAATRALRARLAIAEDDLSSAERLLAGTPESSALLAFAELRLAQRRPEEALRLLVDATLSGAASPFARRLLEQAWRATGGAPDALPAKLDAAYRERHTDAIPAEPYRRERQPSSRVVLAELFTSASCAPCAATDLAFDAALRRYSREDLAVVAYHRHIPRPDPLTVPESETRQRRYAIAGVPFYAIDGTPTVAGGLRKDAAKLWNPLRESIDERLRVAAPTVIALHGIRDGGVLQVSATASGDVGKASWNVLLVEREVTYSGENGIRFHPMVVRAARFGLAHPQTQFDLQAVQREQQKTLDESESLGHFGVPFLFLEKPGMDDTRLAIVAFLQADTGAVLQAAYREVR